MRSRLCGRLAAWLLMLVLVVPAVATAAPGETDVLLVAHHLDRNAASAVIDLSSARGAFKAVRVLVRQQPVEFTNIRVTWSSGSQHDERRTIKLQPGDRTAPIDRRADNRFVDRIEMFYRVPPAAKGDPQVEVYGIQTADGAALRRPVRAQPKPVAAIAPKPAPAQPLPVAAADSGHEVLFGGRTVGFLRDSDVIAVNPEVGRFDRIRLRVLDNDVSMKTVTIEYADGSYETVVINADLKPGAASQWLRVKSDRFIRRISLAYRPRLGFSGRAYVQVYGHYEAGWLGTNGDALKYNKGWMLLGSQSAGFTIDSRDVITVGPELGKFRRIRITVRDEAITLFKVRVGYGAGSVTEVPFHRLKIEPDGSSDDIELPGGPNVIEDIRPTYRTRIFQQGGIAEGRALVEIWGQR